MIKRMLLREVEYARPGSIEEAVRLLGAHDGARALAGGQTLVNVMKARAASPEVLVDLADLAELRDDRPLGRRRRSSSARWSPTASWSARPRSRPPGRSWPRSRRRSPTARCRTAAPSAATSASTTRRNHLPPLFSAMGATFTILGPGRRAHRALRRLLPRRLHDRRRRGRAAHARHACPPARPGAATPWRASRSGEHGTYIVSAAATVGAGRRARRDRLRLGRARARDGARGAPRGCGAHAPRPCTPRSPASAMRSIRPADVHAPPTTAGGSPRSAASAPCWPLRSERRDERERAERQPDDLRRDQRHDLRARGRGEAAARALHPRRSRPDGHAHRLRHRQLRRLHRSSSTARPSRAA